MKKSILNFQVDHMTLLVEPRMYNVAYALFRVVFGVGRTGIIYEKRKEWSKGAGEESMTFAAKIGAAAAEGSRVLDNTIIAVVQPSEPNSQPSHVRSMLQAHNAAAHWQHIALRVPDLIVFHQYAQERGVNFITPILKDADDDLIQVFSGEWYFPGAAPSAMFFEFVQRNPNAELLKKIEERNRESWFRDQTFLGLYGEKEREYQSGKVTPFIDEELFNRLNKLLKPKKIWEITEEDIIQIEGMMLDYGKRGQAALSQARRN